MVSWNFDKLNFFQEPHVGFKWPTSDDIQTVDKRFILYVPVRLNGNLPFHLCFNAQKV